MAETRIELPQGTLDLLILKTVALGPQACTRTIDANYINGTHIHMKITPAVVNGFLLPQTLTADIDEPHLSLSADAAFKNYAFDAPI